MKKLILPIIFLLTAVFSVSSNVDAQTNTDCHEVFNNESNSCLKENTKCLSSCADKAREAMSLTVDGAKVNIGCQRTVCDPASEACNNKAMANFRACIDAREAGKDSQQDKSKEEAPPEGGKEDPFLLKLFGINPYEAWLRIAAWSQAPKLVGFFDVFMSESVEVVYEGGMYRVEVDSPRVFGPNLKITSTGQTSEAQIKLPDQSEYQDLQPDQAIPDESFIKIYKPTRFKVSGEEIEVRPKDSGHGEFQIKRSQKNESVDIADFNTGRVEVELGSVADQKISKPAITQDIEESAWEQEAPKEEAILNVPGTTDVKRYSWDTNSGVVIKSSDWQQTEIKTPPVHNGDFITREVQFKQGDVEVKVRNEPVPKMRFSVKSPDFLEAVSSRTHYLVSYDKDTKQNTVVVYEGKVEVKTNDARTIMVEAKDDKPGVVVITKKLSFVKLGIFSLVIAVIFAGVVWIIKRRKISTKPSRGKSR